MCTGSCLIIFVHAYFIQILDILRNIRLYLLMIHIFDFFNKSLHSLCVEWYIEVTYFEDYTAETPDISFAIVTPFKFLRLLRIIDNLRALIKQSAFIICSCLSFWIVACNPKISNLYSVIFSFEKYIAGLKISMYDIIIMYVMDSQQNFKNKSFNSIFWK